MAGGTSYTKKLQKLESQQKAVAAKQKLQAAEERLSRAKSERERLAAEIDKTKAQRDLAEIKRKGHSRRGRKKGLLDSITDAVGGIFK